MHSAIEVIYTSGEVEQYSPGSEIEVGSRDDTRRPPDNGWTTPTFARGWPRVVQIREPSGDLHYKHIDLVREIRAV